MDDDFDRIIADNWVKPEMKEFYCVAWTKFEAVIQFTHEAESVEDLSKFIVTMMHTAPESTVELRGTDGVTHIVVVGHIVHIKIKEEKD